MRGHSRGDWYGTLDNVTQSEADAEYWAVFGVTHRGNRHCLGEFPTKDAALATVYGLDQTQSESGAGGGSTIMHIEAVRTGEDHSKFELFALFNDGTVWRRQD
jgi:hypothetical protein